MNGIWVQSQEGNFLGIVHDFRVVGYEDGFALVGNYRVIGDGEPDDYDILARYKTREAVIEQIKDICKFMTQQGMLCFANQNGDSITTPMVYDLSERKIQE